MTRYIARRIAMMLPIWIGISLVAFLLAQLAPGDPAQMQAHAALGRPPTADEIAAERVHLGLDRPAPARFAIWVGDALRGDLGNSYRSGEPIRDLLLDRLPKTLQIASLAMLFSLAIAVPIGVISAVRRNSVIDHGARGASLIFSSLPSYWLGYVLILLFAVRLHWLPVAGSGTWRHAVLPAVTLGLGGAAMLIRLTRSEMLEVLSQDYVRTARAKGVAERRVLVGHAFRNALMPLTTMAGMQFAGLLSGAVIVETVFAWPGVGRLAVDAVGARDYPMIQAFVVLSGSLFLAINLAVDIIYTWCDPRIRLGASS
jgi:ABC-type dipeptide/oligopeptide/nickel transport system permease component